MRNISKDTTPRPVALDDYELTYSEMNFAARAQKSEIRPTAEPETTYAQVSFKPKSPQQNQVPEVTPDKDQSRHETAGGRCSGTSTHLGLVALIALISLFVIIIGLIVYALLLKQKLEESQNDQAIERQRTNLLNRTLSASLRDKTMLERKFQNLSVAFERSNETANLLCNTFRNLSESLCPCGWKVQKQKCYKFSTDKRNWNGAKQQCESQKSHFVIINTTEEQNFITKYVKDKKEAHWIGLTDGADEGKWKWVDGSTVSYLNWQKDQPDNYNNEHCATIAKDNRDETFGWNDDGCGKDHPFICEKWALPQIDVADFEKFCS
ncbi:C-type lectin domain family 17, member A-like [Scyliorhinus canicula]|uniref:C-type lectin domain family 17, member A-like n=1 Tax=Scyliorhinus canicula TaxID=7830 RepID=UPI0018F67A8C|nr:C-type lectin domain family 17, member A-like [Scyliorhinus canicula]